MPAWGLRAASAAADAAFVQLAADAAFYYAKSSHVVILGDSNARL
jgi:hypothetical protein